MGKATDRSAQQGNNIHHHRKTSVTTGKHPSPQGNNICHRAQHEPLLESTAAWLTKGADRASAFLTQIALPEETLSQVAEVGENNDRRGQHRASAIVHHHLQLHVAPNVVRVLLHHLKRVATKTTVHPAQGKHAATFINGSPPTKAS